MFLLRLIIFLKIILGLAGQMLDPLIKCGMIRRIYPSTSNNVFLKNYVLPLISCEFGKEFINIPRYYEIVGNELALYIQIPEDDKRSIFASKEERPKPPSCDCISIGPGENPNLGCNSNVVTATGPLVYSGFYKKCHESCEDIRKCKDKLESIEKKLVNIELTDESKSPESDLKPKPDIKQPERCTQCTNIVDCKTGKIIGICPDMISYYITRHMTCAVFCLMNDINTFPESKKPFKTYYGYYMGFINDGSLIQKKKHKPIIGKEEEKKRYALMVKSDMFSKPYEVCEWPDCFEDVNFTIPSNSFTEILTIYNLIKRKLKIKKCVTIEDINKMKVSVFLEQLSRHYSCKYLKTKRKKHVFFDINIYLYSVVENFKTLVNDEDNKTINSLCDHVNK